MKLLSDEEGAECVAPIDVMPKDTNEKELFQTFGIFQFSTRRICWKVLEREYIKMITLGEDILIKLIITC